MTIQRILTLLLTAIVFSEAKWHHILKRDTVTICDTVYSNANKVQCYCVKDVRDPEVIVTADCYVTAENVKPTDPSWKTFELLKDTHKLTLTNTRGIALTYIPTNALALTTALLKLDIKYGNIEKLQPYAFANSSSLEEISLRDSQVQVLSKHSFAHHRDLTLINMDKNNVVEINRDVFVDLPSLEKLFLTSNKITTLHDKAFVHLTNLRELEINMNKIFSLNSETFSGLKNLLKLDLSSNSLEVIGDNTFLPLKNLQSLNIESNNIQMLDEKAFYGLNKLQHLSLARNKIALIENKKVFAGLESLSMLNLRGNEIHQLNNAVMAPILNHFYAVDGNLDIEDNHFPCDCRLDWFMKLMNRTQSKSLKMALENLKCLPDAKTRDAWTKIEENDKSSGQIFEEDNAPSSDYEYYDDTQLNGKLFYTDIRFLLNCTEDVGLNAPKFATAPTVKPETTSARPGYVATKMPANLPRIQVTEPPKTEAKKPINHRLLDLSDYDTTTKPNEDKTGKEDGKKKSDSYTTNRLATVSANPIENKNMYDGMASDEAKPDNVKTHRSVQEEFKDTRKMNFSNAPANAGCAILVSMILSLRLFY